MAEVPNVTANEMLAYKGNAAQGGSGVDYAYNPAIADPTAAIADTMKQFSAYANQLQTKQYDQKLKEREDLMKFLADTGQSVFNMKDAQGNNVGFNMLPQDKQELLELARQKREAVLANPSGYRFDKKVAEIDDRFNAIKNMAGQRSVELSKMQKAAAETNDPDERARILKHIDDNILKTKVSDFKQVEPYMPDYKFDAEVIFPKDLFTKKENLYDVGVKTEMRNGSEVKVVERGLIPQVADFRDRVRADKNALTNIKNMVNAYMQSPIVKTEAGIKAISDEAREANRVRKLTGTGHQIIPFDELPRDADAVEVAYSLLGPSKMMTNKSEELEKGATEVAKDNLGMKKTLHDMAIDNEELKIKWQQLENDKEKLKNERKNLTKADYDQQMDDIVAKETALDLRGLIDATFKGEKRAYVNKIEPGIMGTYRDKDGKFHELKETNPILYKNLSDLNIDLRDVHLAKLPNVQAVYEMTGEQQETDKGGIVKASKQPASAYIMMGKDGKKGARLVFEFGEGKDNVTAKVVTLKDAIKNMTNSRANWAGDKTKNIVQAQRYFEDLINEETNKPETPKAETEVTGKDGVKYIKVNGEWFVKP